MLAAPCYYQGASTRRRLFSSTRLVLSQDDFSWPGVVINGVSLFLVLSRRRNTFKVGMASYFFDNIIVSEAEWPSSSTLIIN